MPYIEILDKSIPRDPNARSVAVLYGYDPMTEEYFPMATTAGKLSVDATFGGSITIGNVSIKDPVGAQMANVTTDGRMLVSIDDNAIVQTNMTAMYTYDASDRVATIKEYPTGAGVGTPAKLTTYTYKVGAPGDGKVLGIVVTSTTV